MMTPILIDKLVNEEFGKVRDLSPSGRNTVGGGALLRELYEVSMDLNGGNKLEELKGRAAGSQILRKTAYESRTRIWRALSHRYIEPGCTSCTQTLVRGAMQGAGSPEFISLAYLLFALRDRLTFDFITGPVWQKWNQQSTVVALVDFLSFLDDQAQEYSKVRAWKESTRKKLASNTLSSLRDFGLLKGVRRRQIQRPAIAPETVFQLLAILDAEGLKGRAVLEAPDWRLFLWGPPDVSRSLGELSQKGWIRFEKAGRTVILQLIRDPGGMS